MIQARPMKGSERTAGLNPTAADAPIDRIIRKIGRAEFPCKEQFEDYLLQK